LALMLGMQITGDFSGLNREVKETRGEFAGLSAEAGKLEREALDAAKGLSAIEREAAGAAVSLDAVQRKLAAVQPGDRVKLTAAEFRTLTEDAQRSGRSFEEVLGGNRAALDAMRAAHDPLFAAQREYLDQLASIRAAHAAGALPQKEMEAALARTKAGFAAQVPIIRSAQAAALDHSKAIALQRHQLVNLGQQVQDVGVQLALGMNPLIIAAQQGPQIVSATGGLKNFTALARQFITPTVLATAGLTAVLATGAAAWGSYLGSVKPVETALAGVGRRIGQTRGEMEALARASADQGGISVSEARELEVAFLRTGRIGTDVMGALIARTKDYAATTGMDLPAAAEELAKAFAEPKEGAENLNKTLQVLSDTEAQEIRRMIERGDVVGAQLAMIEALDRGTVDHEESATALGRAWNSVANAISNTWNALGSGIDASFSGSEDATRERLARLLADRDRLLQSGAKGGAGTLLALRDRQIEQIEREIADAARIGAASEIAAASVRAGALGRRHSPDAGKLETLRLDRQQASSALEDPAIRDSVDSLSSLERAYDATGRALDTYLTPAQRVSEQHRIDLAALNAKTPAQKAEIAAQRERLQLAGETIPAAEAQARIEAAAARALAEATHAITEQNQQLSLNTQLTLRSAEGWLQSAAAGARAEAMQRGLTDAFNEGADAATRARLALQEQVAQTALSGAQTIAGLNAETVTRARLNSAVLSGTMTLQEANRQASLAAELRPLLIARDNAEGTSKEVLTRIIEELTAARARLNDEEGRAAAASIVAGQEGRLTMLRREAELVFAGTTARERELAILSATLDARRASVAAGSDEERQIRENATAISDLVSQLEREGQTRDIVMRTTENALDRVADQLAQGKLDWSSWGGLVTSVLQDVIAQLARMAITAPIMNSLFGTRATTLDDAGGFIGGLFGSFHSGGLVGKGSNDNRALPLSTFRGAPRLHKGGLVSGERAIIALDTEEVLTLDDPRHINNLRRASGGGRGFAGGGALAGEPRIVVNNFPASGTKIETTTRRGSNGELVIENIGRQLKDDIASEIAAGEGPITGAIEGRFGLNRAFGLQR